MKLIQTVADMQAEADRARREGQTLALVPTMGALHEGHLELVRTATRQANHVTVSIFVNPTQFGPNEDFDRYPRTLEEDLRRLEAVGGVAAVFAPTMASMYPEGEKGKTWVEVEKLDQHLCGASRPGHFRGVTTVVAKLFNSCKPHHAFFGLKDAQQFLLLRRMVLDLNFDIEVVGVPTVREPDGLALSSRNRYLSPSERAQAVVLSRAAGEARRLILAGEQRAPAIVESMTHVLKGAPDARVEYAVLVDTRNVQPIAQLVTGQEVLAAVAVFFGKTRLIDNVFVAVP